MPARPRKASEDADQTEQRLTRGAGTGVRKLLAQSASLMRARESLHASTSFKDQTASRELALFSSYYRIKDPVAVFKRCRELAQTTGFIEWVLHLKKLLFNDGLQITGLEKEEEREGLARVVRDIWQEYLVQDSAPAIWKEAGEGLPVVQIVDCEGVTYENDFGEETLGIKYDARPVSEAQKAKLGSRYADALSKGEVIVWGAEAGEDFAVLTNAKLGMGLGRPRLFSIFEDLAVHGLLVKGDWNAAWTAKDVIRQFSVGHEIKSGNMQGLPVHFLKASMRDAIHKSVKDKSGAFDIVTNFDVELKYPAFDFDFFKEEKFKAVRQRLLEWAGPVGTFYLDIQSRDDEALLTILNAEMRAARADVARLFQKIIAKEGFGSVKAAALKWDSLTLASLQRKISLINTMANNGVMSKKTARSLLELDDKAEGDNLDLEHKTPERYAPAFQPFQGQGASSSETTPPTPEGGRPPAK